MKPDWSNRFKCLWIAKLKILRFASMGKLLDKNCFCFSKCLAQNLNKQFNSNWEKKNSQTIAILNFVIFWKLLAEFVNAKIREKCCLLENGNAISITAQYKRGALNYVFVRCYFNFLLLFYLFIVEFQFLRFVCCWLVLYFPFIYARSSIFFSVLFFSRDKFHTYLSFGVPVL